MSFKAYDEYKDSGIEWVGEVPADWKVMRSDAYIKSVPISASASFLEGKKVFHYSIPVVQNTGDGQYEDGSEIESSKLILTEDQVLVSKLNPRKGTVCLASPKEKLTVCSGEFVPLSSKQVDLGYLLYLVRTTNFRTRLESLVESATRSHQRVTPEEIIKFNWAFPTRSEQTTIAAFLDHETARIDALIEEQQRLIALLKEKRQAVISHAVTKGLDPNVPMKDSGVEWLGEVPAHWGHTSKLNQLVDKRANSFVNGPFGSDLLASELTSSGVPVIYIRDLKTWGYTRISVHHVTSKKAIELDFCSVIAGDVLVSKVGDPPGTSVVYPNDEPKAIITQDVIRIRPSTSKINPHYLSSMINSCYGMFAIKQISVSSTRTRISLGDFKQLKLPIPPIKEQVELVNYMKKAIRSINNLEKEASNTIALMKERRSALISAAVTGKIDVSDWQPPEASQTAHKPAEASA